MSKNLSFSETVALLDSLYESDNSITMNLDLSNFVSDDIKKIIADKKICRIELEDIIDHQITYAKKTGRCPICGGELNNLNCQNCKNSFRQEGTFGLIDNAPVVDQELLDSIKKVYPGFEQLDIDDKVDYIFSTFVLNNKDSIEYFSELDPTDPKYKNAVQESQAIKNTIKNQLSSAYKYSKYQKTINPELVNNI